MRVILEAVFELDSAESEILRDDEGKICLDQKGDKIITPVKDLAYQFLSGQNKSLYYICSAIGVNAKAIVKDLKILGPVKLKERFLEYITNRGE